MAQNIYDDPQFFAAYSQFRRSVHGLDGAAEWPSLRALLPPMAGLRVVDLGCGFGWFCRWAADEGAARVLGLDLSEKMLARARAETASEAVSYRQTDLETLELPEGAFDVAHSSLTLHYLEDLDRLVAQLSRALVPGGRFVFSTEHPIYLAPAHPGWTTSATGERIWPLDGYLREGPRSTDWLAKGVIKHHRTLGTTLNTLIHHGFAIRHVEEWRPSAAQLAEAPQLDEELDRPMFLLVAATREGA
jgi:SAM-dependent methyltransferase